MAGDLAYGVDLYLTLDDHQIPEFVREG